MRVVIGAVGRLKSCPESTLVDDYLLRFARTGRPLGLGPCDVREVDERKATQPARQAKALEKLIAPGSLTIALDERGKARSSTEFAHDLAAWRDNGQPEVIFMIGGADGLDTTIRHRADQSMSFGKMVWPHILVRVMLAEQLYRAATILAGAPYHRA